MPCLCSSVLHSFHFILFNVIHEFTWQLDQFLIKGIIIILKIVLKYLQFHNQPSNKMSTAKTLGYKERQESSGN